LGAAAQEHPMSPFRTSTDFSAFGDRVVAIDRVEVAPAARTSAPVAVPPATPARWWQRLRDPFAARAREATK
jgi:hypothetical protein